MANSDTTDDDLPTVAEVRGILKDYPAVGARDSVCAEILDIMRTYHEQDAQGFVDTPGGLEHMGDVWRLFMRWEEERLNEQS